jgi:hypothetical protein
MPMPETEMLRPEDLAYLATVAESKGQIDLAIILMTTSVAMAFGETRGLVTRVEEWRESTLESLLSGMLQEAARRN